MYYSLPHADSTVHLTFQDASVGPLIAQPVGKLIFFPTKTEHEHWYSKKGTERGVVVCSWTCIISCDLFFFLLPTCAACYMDNEVEPKRCLILSQSVSLLSDSTTGLNTCSFCSTLICPLRSYYFLCLQWAIFQSGIFFPFSEQLKSVFKVSSEAAGHIWPCCMSSKSFPLRSYSHFKVWVLL